MNNPKVFISYSWDNEPHKEWVLNLATKLREKGVDVILDVWELTAGKDKDYFMENSVADSDRVLLILTPAYKTKAENRQGGASNEVSMIRAEKFSDQKTEKFIPIVRLGDRKNCTPLFIESLLHIDMSIDDNFEKSFEELLRVIYNEPKNKKPPLGEKPQFDTVTSEKKHVADDELKGYSDIAKILQLYQPKSQFIEYPKVEDKAQKVGYSLFARENKPFNTVEYYLYLYKGIIKNATFDSLQKKHDKIFKTQFFTMLIPREEEQTKQERRKENIQKKFKPTSIYYIDEFIWNHCTPTSFTEITTDSKLLDINNFVTPRVEDENKQDKKFNDLIEWLSSQNEQVLVLRGSGGIGKTTIAKHIADVFQDSNKQKKSIFIESSEIIDELQHAKRAEQEINIYSFYDADCSRSDYTQDRLNKDLFKINLDNGNLLIVIDGLDEIISKVSNFDVDAFLRSIFESYSEIGSAKVIITCRTHFWHNSKLDDYSLKVLDLLPFDEIQAKKFFDKSFNTTDKKTDKCIKIAKEFVSQSKNQEPYEFQPYVLDIIRNIIDSDYELLYDNYSFDSKYLIQKNKSDYIIYNVCHREMKRINQISVDKQIEVFMALSVQNDGVIVESKFQDLFTNIDSSKIEAFKSHPFISTDASFKKNVFIKYDFLIDVFKGIYLKSLLDINNDVEISKNTIHFIASNGGLNSNLVREVVSRSQKLLEEEILKVADIIEKIQNFDVNNIVKIKAISGLFSLMLRINHQFMGGSNIENNTKLMDELFKKSDGIHNLAMFNFSFYEKQLRFDFSNRILINCYIDNFSDFWTCKFDENTRFIKCTLNNLPTDSKIQIKENQFIDCEKDGSINDVFINSDLKEKNVEKKISKFLDSFFNLFMVRGRLDTRLIDIVKGRYTGIKPQLFNLERLIKLLEDDNIITDYYDDTQQKRRLKVNDDYKMDITKFCKEGTPSVKIHKIIKLLIKNLNRKS